MTRCLLRFLLLACGIWAPLAVREASGEPPGQTLSSDRLNQLIESLASDDFATRQAAFDELSRIGLPAFSALEAARAHPDPEVRYSSQRILALIRQNDLARRLDEFLSGQGQSRADPLPGWRRFQQSYGDTAQSRQMFVEMQRADAELLQALEESPRAAADLLGQRTLQYQQTLQFGGEQLTLGQITSALFVASQADVPLPAQTVTTLFTQCHQPSFREALEGGRRDIPRKMLGAIIRRTEDSAAYSAMIVAYQFNLPEGVAAAEKILRGDSRSRSPHIAQYALMTIARLGNESHLPLVQRLLRDTSLVTRMQENQTVYDVQLRDAALAAAVMLTGQDPRMYFEIPPGQPLADPQVIFFNARIIGFPSEEKRAAAFEKWAKYKAGQRP